VEEQMKLKDFGYLCLDYFTRTWTAFWGTLAFCIGYIVWQHIPSARHFDQFPYLGLCTVVTLLSYFQNIIIMTIQREDHEIQKILEIAEELRDKAVFEMVEDIHEELVEDGIIGQSPDAEEVPTPPGSRSTEGVLERLPEDGSSPDVHDSGVSEARSGGSEDPV
jgi:hypothetical protein